MKNILIIGGAGYIGSACVNSLVNTDHNVTVFDDLSTGQIDKVNTKAKIINGNILDISALEQVFSTQSFDSVIHFAAKKSVSESEEYPEKYFENNVTGTLNVLSMMSKYHVPQIIFSSTAAVYKPKNDEHAVYDEDSEVEPINVYGRTKYMCELAIKDFVRLGKIRQYTIFRYFNVAGDAGLNFIEQNAQNVFPLLTKAILNDIEFRIFGNDYQTKDGTGVRDYIHIDDLVSAHVLALKNKNSGIYNLGTRNGYSVQDLIAAFEQHANKKMNVQILPRRKGDPATVVADAKKAGEALGWKPEKDVSDMVKSTLSAYGYVPD